MQVGPSPSPPSTSSPLFSPPLPSSPSSVSSPPHTPTDMLEAADLLRRSPASSARISAPVQVPARNLSFSIENILRPSFPAAKKTQPPPAPPAKKAPPKIDVEVPVDLSKTSNEAPKADADCPPGMVRGPNGQLWPAWVFCTRYSDRPSSGPRVNSISPEPSSSISTSSSLSSSSVGLKPMALMISPRSSAERKSCFLVSNKSKQTLRHLISSLARQVASMISSKSMSAYASVLAMVMCVSPTHTSETDPVCLRPSVWQDAPHHYPH